MDSLSFLSCWSRHAIPALLQLTRRGTMLMVTGGVSSTCRAATSHPDSPRSLPPQPGSRSATWSAIRRWRTIVCSPRERECASQMSTAPDRHATGCAFADVDGDGDQDLVLVALGGPNAVFVNDGKGHFTEQTRGLSDTAGSMTVAVADVDGDGDLDLYIANYKAYTTLDRYSPEERGFDRVTKRLGPDRYEVREPYRRDYKLVDRPDLGGISLQQRADPDFFYLNDGTGHFTREPIASNPRFRDEQGRPLAEEREDFGLDAVFADVT